MKFKKTFNGTIPDLKFIKSQIYKHYGDEIEFENIKSDIIIIFEHKITKDVWKNWFENKNKDIAVERARIVEMPGRHSYSPIR